MANSAVITADDAQIRERATNKQHTTLQPYCRPEASSSRRQHHKREAAHPRCIRAHNPSPRIGRAGGAGAKNTPTTPYQPSPTATHEKKTNPLCSGVLVSVVAVLAAAACDSVAATRACCHRLPFHVPDHHHAASLLFCSSNAAGIVFCMSSPTPF